MSSPVALSVPKADSISSKPQPLNGWTTYQNYLTEQNRVSKNQELGKTVELHFLIDRNGLPAKIEVTKSAGGQLDNEAVRLVKEGSKWKYIEGTPNQVILKVQF
nr:energy transducer TonB [Pedobacter montanisoli]